MQSIRPPRLKSGDLIALVSPASTPSPSAKIEGSVRYLEKLGYRVMVGRHAASQHGYLAGTDAQRAEDFNSAVQNPEVRAVFALRGGYGTPRILPLIDYRALAREPKIISGFSDITALQLAIYKKIRLVTFSGAMPAVEFWNDPDGFTEESFWPLLTEPESRRMIPNPPENPVVSIKPGKAAGVLLGGNLSLVVSILGTEFAPSFRNVILALEDVDEAPYRIDRMMTQLRNADIFANSKAILLGQFTGCESDNPEKPALSLDQIFHETLHSLEQPILSNLQYGHIPKKATLPFGVKARVDAGLGKLELLESPVI